MSRFENKRKVKLSAIGIGAYICYRTVSAIIMVALLCWLSALEIPLANRLLISWFAHCKSDLGNVQRAYSDEILQARFFNGIVIAQAEKLRTQRRLK